MLSDASWLPSILKPWDPPMGVLRRILFFFFFQAEDGIRDSSVTGVQTCALPISFAGFMLYPTETGWVEAQNFYDEALAGVRAHGLQAAMVSTGGTPNLKNVGKLKGATEHRPGTYIYNDRMQVAAGVASWDDCALNIYSTVVSRAGPDRGILDAGSKTLTSDTGGR